VPTDPAVSIPCAYDVGNLVRQGDLERHVLSIHATRSLKPGTAPFVSVAYLVTDVTLGWLMITEADLVAWATVP
jgi:hypothetical protein